MAKARSRRPKPEPLTLAVLLAAVAAARGEVALLPCDGWPTPNGSAYEGKLRDAAARFAARYWPDGARAIDERSWVRLPGSCDWLFSVVNGTQAYAITLESHRFPDPDVFKIYRLGPLEEFIAPGADSGPQGGTCARLVWRPRPAESRAA